MIERNQEFVKDIKKHIVLCSKEEEVDLIFDTKDKGIKNSTFHLLLIDKDLTSIDPRDPRLNEYMKRKVLRECMNNYWYFLREIVRIPDHILMKLDLM